MTSPGQIRFKGRLGGNRPLQAIPGVTKAGETATEFKNVNFTPDDTRAFDADKPRARRALLREFESGQLSAVAVRELMEILGILPDEAPTAAEGDGDGEGTSVHPGDGDGAVGGKPGGRTAPGPDTGGPNRPRRRSKIASTRNWRGIANTLRDNRGEWKPLPVTNAEQSLSKLACSIRTGATGTWAPRGAFEARIVGATLEARYMGVGNAEPVVPRGRDREGRFLPDREAS